MENKPYSVFTVKSTGKKIKAVPTFSGLLKDINNGLYYFNDELILHINNPSEIKFGIGFIWVYLKNYYQYKIIYLPSISIRYFNSIDIAIDIEFAVLIFSITIRFIIIKPRISKFLKYLNKK